MCLPIFLAIHWMTCVAFKWLSETQDTGWEQNENRGLTVGKIKSLVLESACALSNNICREFYISFWTVVLERTLESPLNSKEIQPVHPIGNQSWISIGRTDAEAETPILWPPDAKNRLIWKDPDAGKDWRREEKGTTKDEMVGWHHWLNGHEFE